MKSVLSTKKLSPAQKELLLNAGLSFVEYDAVLIEPVEFNVPSQIQYALFTSQNAVESFVNNAPDSIQIEHVLCVGTKTANLLSQNGIKVTKIAKNSTELAQNVINMAQNGPFYYFCGTQRRDELPDALKLAKIDLIEVKTYKTELNLLVFEQKWDGILFFSPSGIESYSAKNSIDSSVAFCIGETTASEAKKYTQNVVVANTTSVESVIAKAAKKLKYVEN